jgi:hypothetical protein
MTTLNTMVKRVSGLQGTSDLTDWVETFVESIVEKTRDGADTSMLTERQITTLERLFKQHFAA